MEEIQNFPPCGGLFSGCFSFCLCTENSVSLLCSTHFTGLAILMLKNSLQIIFEAFFPGFYNSIHFSEQSWVAIEAKIVRSGNTVKNKGLITKGDLHRTKSSESSKSHVRQKSDVLDLS